MKEGVIRTSVTENGVEKEFEVEEVSNGFVITVRESGYKKVKGSSEKEWFNDTTKYISETNPLVEKSVDMKTMISDALAGLKL